MALQASLRVPAVFASGRLVGPRLQWPLLVMALAFTSGPAFAHSFQVGFLAPLSGPQAGLAEQARDGFMLATTERDSHPDQHSDGHLGGLDVYVRLVDTAQPLDVVRRSVRRLLRERKVEVLTGVTTAGVADVVRGELPGTPAVLVAVDESRFSGDHSTDTPFVDAFRAQFGYTPSGAAHVGYCLAHTIDRAVRALGGDFSDPDRLLALLGEVGC